MKLKNIVLITLLTITFTSLFGEDINEQNKIEKLKIQQTCNFNGTVCMYELVSNDSKHIDVAEDSIQWKITGDNTSFASYDEDLKYYFGGQKCGSDDGNCDENSNPTAIKANKGTKYTVRVTGKIDVDGKVYDLSKVKPIKFDNSSYERDFIGSYRIHLPSGILPNGIPEDVDKNNIAKELNKNKPDSIDNIEYDATNNDIVVKCAYGFGIQQGLTPAYGVVIDSSIYSSLKEVDGEYAYTYKLLDGGWSYNSSQLEEESEIGLIADSDSFNIFISCIPDFENKNNKA